MTTTFPAHVLGIKVEILLNSVWTDISVYVQQRNPISITGMGRSDWNSSIQACQMALTLKNVDGRFTPKNTSGAYYPNIGRNVQIRLSVDSESSSLVAYSGFRFWGEVTSWPPKWDPTQTDIYCDITASGRWRRISQMQAQIGSPYRRYNLNTIAPRAYWSMEDGNGSLNFVAGSASTIAATWSGAANAVPGLAGDGAFIGSDAIMSFNQAVVLATVPAGGTPTNNVTRFALHIPAGGDPASGSTSWNIAEINSAGTIAKFELYLNANGTLDINLRNSGGTIVASATTTTNVQNNPVIVSMELTPSGGNVAWAVRLITPNALAITESKTGTITTASVGTISTVRLNRSAKLTVTAVGHLSVTYASVPSLVTAASAAAGYAGEFALDRFTRICGEFSIAAEAIGTANTSAQMGPQIDGTLPSVLQSIEDTDCGLLFESRGQFGLGYRTNANMTAQAVALTLNYATATLAGTLEPVYDDQQTKNNVTVTNYDGYAVQSILNTGAMSILDPPSGIGNGYQYTRSVSAFADSQIAGISTKLLGIGAVDEPRFPVITLDMTRAAMVSLFSAVPSTRVGDYIQITNPPAGFLTGTVIRQLAWGYTEVLNAFTWTFQFNAVPESPWEVGFSPGSIATAQVVGAVVTGSQATTAGNISSLIGNDLLSSLGLITTIVTASGGRITVDTVAPSTPNDKDEWINSLTGLISIYNLATTTWVPVIFDGTVTVKAGTITATQILAATITATQIAAATIVAGNISSHTITAAQISTSIVIAGIVDATTVNASTYIATSSQGEFLAYDTAPPSSGHLISSIAGAAGTDVPGNAYPKGLFSQQLTLQNQSSAPAAFSGASSFYSSVANRPRYLSGVGTDSVLERSVVNVAQFPIGNTTTPTAISAFMSYLANEGDQSSEYEVEADGIATVGTGAAQTLSFQLFSDGSALGPHVTIGAVFLVGSGVTYNYTVRARLAILTSATVIMTMDGNISKAANAGSETTFPVLSSSLQAITNGVSWDSTLAHTLQMFATWGGTNTSQTLTTYRTKLTRRM